MKNELLIQYITKGSKVAARPKNLQDAGKWGNKIGVMIGYKEYNKEKNVDEIFIGYSLRNKKEDLLQFSTRKETLQNKAFDKNKAIFLAKEKAISLSPLMLINSEDVFLKLSSIPKSLNSKLRFFLKRCEKYFQNIELTHFWKQIQVILETDN